MFGHLSGCARYILDFFSPHFCTIFDVAYPAKASSSLPNPPVVALLDGLRDTCMNYTLGYWTYSYCHPYRCTQFHRNPDGTTPKNLCDPLLQPSRCQRDGRQRDEEASLFKRHS